MERLTPVGATKRGIGLHIGALVLLLLGPSVVARVVSFSTSLVTFPLTRELRIEDNRYETFNTELLLIYIIAVLGMNLLFQTGVLSLGHSALFGLGAYSVAILTVDYGWSYWPALAVAGVLTTIIGLLLALPSVKLGVFTLAMVTVGYAFVFEDLAIEWKGITGGGDGLRGIQQPPPFDDLSRYYWLVVIGVVLTYFLCHNLLRSPMGRASKSVEENAIASKSVGIRVNYVKLRAFALSALMAGVAGGLYAPLLGFVSPDSFTVNLAISLVLMVLFGGTGTLAGPIVGAVLLFRIPIEVERLTNQPGEWSLLVYGVVLLASVHFFPEGLVAAWWWVRDRIWGRSKVDADSEERARADVASVLNPVDRQERPALNAQSIEKSFGGVKPLSDVSMVVAPGQVHALIGPNGSGKTTFLNCVSGYLDHDGGTLEMLGRDGAGVAPDARARMGLARTFQTPYVFEGMSCLENVLVSLDQKRKQNLFAYAWRWPGARREERQQYDRAVEIVRAVGLGERLSDAAGDLPPGERRLLELGRVIAMQPELVLMDEPAAGLTSGEIEELEEVIRGLSAAGIAVVIVEHHVDLVMRLADEITVIDFGRQIAHGPPSEIQENPTVIAAYLGEDTDDETMREIERQEQQEPSA
ncbi:MAG: ABC transporter permease subunit [Microthrixaceae bacterium]